MIATVVGNFPKVGDSHEEQKLRRAIEAHQQGKISAEELEAIENEVTREAIETQIVAGIKLISDGQIRWTDPVTWITRKLKGISITGLIRFFDNNVYYRQPVVQSPIGWTEPILVKDYEFAKGIVRGRAELKAILPGPFSLAKLSRNDHYGRFEDLVFDFARALAKEAEALEKAGATFIQFDEPSVPYYPENILMAAKAIEICTTPLSKSKVALYTYFSGISKVFESLIKFPIQVLGVDIVSDSENTKLLQTTSCEKELALGVVDARNTKIEKEEDLNKLIQSFEKNLTKIQYINPSSGLEFLPRDVAVKKLKLIGTVAEKTKSLVS